jgi:serine acetyltransferase
MKKQSVSAGALTVVTGNHARIVGRFLLSIKDFEKPNGLDKDVIVNEDVWMGLNVTLLSGVEIGRGATIASGAVVTKSIPPYCIAGGVPAKVIKFYWTIDEILKHEAALYAEEDRYKKDELLSIFNTYK